MDQIKIGQFIAERRKDQGMTQRQLAERLGISDKTISKWECGNGLPEISMMMPLCEMLQINVNELLSGEKLSMDDYPGKAEENMVKLIQTTEEQGRKRRRIFLAVLMYAAAICGMVVALVVSLMPGDAGALGNYFFEPLNLGVMTGVLALFLLGADSVRPFGHALQIAAGKTEESLPALQEAYEAVKFAGATLLYTGILVSLFYLVTVLYQMDEPSHIGPYLSLALTGSLYGVFANLLLLPVKIRLVALIREREVRL